MERAFRPTIAFVVALGACIALAAMPARAAPVFLDAEGEYSDDFTDDAGLSLQQNVKIGHPLQPGVKVSLLEWVWGQSIPEASKTVVTYFDDPGAQMNLTEVETDPETSVQFVQLWDREFAGGSGFTLAPGVSTTTYVKLGVKEKKGDFAFQPGTEILNGEYMVRGPYQTDLLSRREYTATFKSSYCDDPTCEEDDNPGDSDGADIATVDVFHGITLASFKMRLRGYVGGASGLKGTFPSEFSVSPVTLEFEVPDPLPAWKGFEYRTLITLSGTGAVPCSPFCTATLWFESVRVMAKGRPVPFRSYVTSCPPGEVICGWRCVPDNLPCGGDSATYYGGSGSYLSPAFDSLSDKTEWTKIEWKVEQNFGSGRPTTPVGIKWRVGNDPDPSTWLPDPDWFSWTVPMTATCTLCPGEPGPMDNEDEFQLFADGDPAKIMTGRYFQYEVDLTGQYNNGRAPPEASYPSTRELHDTVQPALEKMAVYYRPAAGRIISNTIAPSKLKGWESVSYVSDVASGGTVQVDVLDESNVPLFSNIPPFFSLAGLDSDEYPRIRLRATVDNEGDPAKRPRLLGWQVKWEVQSAPLQLDRNSLSLKSGEVVRVTMVVSSSRDGNLAVYDVAGQLIKELSRGTFMEGLNSWTWDGTNEKGHRVVAGVYFVSLKTGDTREIRTIAVVP